MFITKKMDILIQTAVYSYNAILLSKTRNSTKWLNLTGVILNQRNHKNEYINKKQLFLTKELFGNKYYMYCPLMGRAVPHSPFPPRELAPTRTQPSFQG